MKVKFFAFFRNYAKCKETDVPLYNDLRELLDFLCQKYGKEFEGKVYTKNREISDEVIILINGRHIAHLEGINTKLKEGDEVCIFPVAAGG
ncbi:molybdopterin synthase sulfur carrier subunit [Caloramator quimbayensis]|uniref:Molybdopterin synthase sulfur carrier subunit n=1 Tax=Caloramator quimbayensis TaxID=1147123 RepID=A0A1T4Y9U6_9CLOT|nr:ubiquitin-like small modifier protein 1 [Caloramator quimbayensis]SKA98045.1 molybdopterin synthase sulfur carrier subunit [Caloramator quimbayensis]